MLFVFASQHNKRSMSQLVKYMLDIAMGMHYISAKGLIHKVRFSVTIIIIVVRCATVCARVSCTVVWSESDCGTI